MKDFQRKLGCVDSMFLRLQIAKEKAQKVEEKYHESKAIMEDKEERLVASKWAILYWPKHINIDKLTIKM